MEINSILLLLYDSFDTAIGNDNGRIEINKSRVITEVSKFHAITILFTNN